MKRYGWLLALLLLPGTMAHAEPYESQPASGARLADAPHVASVSFTEPVFEEGSWIRVFDSVGDRVDYGDLRIQGTERPVMTVTLHELTDGAYRIGWQTYSVTDGHTVRGSIGFAVGDFAAPDSEVQAETAFDAIPSLARFLLYAGFAAGLGGLIYAAWMRAPLPARSIQAGSILAVAGTALLTWDTWQGTGLELRVYLGSDGGGQLLARLFVTLALLAFTFLWTQVRPGLRTTPILLGGLWCFAGWQTAQWGHVTQHGDWGIVVEWLHLVAAAAWVGGLASVAVHLTKIDDPREVGKRFGALASTCVALIAISGLVLTVTLVRDTVRYDPGALWTDSWTWFLAAKLVAFTTMLGAAAINRYGYLNEHPPAWLADWLPRRSLRSVIRFEAGTGVVAILAAGMLLSVSPPQTIADPAPSVDVTTSGDAFAGRMQVTPEPNVNATHTLRFYLESLDSNEHITNNTCGRDDCIRARWTLDDDPSTEQEAVALPDGDGWWRVDSVLFTQTGNATVRLDVQTGYVYLDVLEFPSFTVT